MKDLLTACRTYLRSEVAAVADADIFLTVSLELGNKGGSYPAIGIKDGGIGRGQYASQQADEVYRLTVAAYVYADEREELLLGNSGESKIGGLDLAEQILDALEGELFSDRFDAARVTAIGASVLLDHDSGRMIAMVPVSVEYDLYK